MNILKKRSLTREFSWQRYENTDFTKFPPTTLLNYLAPNILRPNRQTPETLTVLSDTQQNRRRHQPWQISFSHDHCMFRWTKYKCLTSDGRANVQDCWNGHDPELSTWMLKSTEREVKRMSWIISLSPNSLCKHSSSSNTEMVLALWSN